MLKLVKPNKDLDYVCLYQPYPGLGDHLQHSTLPRLYFNKGKKVFISNKCVYKNEEVKDLVWRMNPYVSGFSDLEPNIGLSCRNIQNKAVSVWKPTNISLLNIESSHGFLTSGKPKPEVYYSPKIAHDALGSCILDASASNFINRGYTKEIILNFVKNFDNVYLLKSNRLDYKDYEYVDLDFKTFYANSIFEYCDYISSCKNFICLLSGSHSLAQSLRKNNIYCIISNYLYNIHYEKGLFINDSAVNYIKF